MNKLATLALITGIACTDEAAAPDMSRDAAHAAVDIVAKFPFPRKCEELQDEVRAQASEYVDRFVDKNVVVLKDQNTTIKLTNHENLDTGLSEYILTFSQLTRAETEEGVFLGSISGICLK